MAFSFFGKKDKNTPEDAAPVAKAPPTPPKIQTPPAPPGAPAMTPTVKPPQPSGLIPTSGMPARANTTQPMVMPRAGGSGLKPTRPGVAQSSRSTQRIVLPAGTPGARSNATKPLSLNTPAGRINLPMGMILRNLPPEVLAADISEFEASGAAATEIGLPMNMILGQLPSGKVEMTLADLVPHFPAGYLQPTESIASYLPTVINLPLMDVVMRIPPDLLALRPDQKDVDAAVINMADPFTEEILREQAEAARKAAAAQAAQANIIDESQVPQAEEFVPQAKAEPKTIAPPPRQAAPAAVPVIQTPQTTRMPAPSMPVAASPVPTVPAVPPATPSASARTISPSGRITIPTRSTAAVPARTQAPQFQPPPPISTPAPPVPRQTSSLPAFPRPSAAASAPPMPPVPRQTTTLPPISSASRPTMGLPLPPQPPVPTFTPPPPVQVAPSAPVVLPEPEPEPEPEPAPEPVSAVTAGEPDTAAQDLQRLAALAMAQLEDSGETASIPQPSSVTVPITASTAKMPEAYVPDVPPPVIAPPPVAEAPQPLPVPVAPPAPAIVTQRLPEPLVPPATKFATPAPGIATQDLYLPETPAVAASRPPVPVAAPRPPVPMLPPEPAPTIQPPVALKPAPEPIAAIKTAPLPEPAPTPAPVPVAAEVEAPQPEPVDASAQAAAAAATAAGMAFNLNTCTADDLVQNIPGCFRELAESIVEHRTKIGSFNRIEDLLDVPGITKAAYTNLTGEAPPENRIPLSLNELLGFPPELHISLKDVTDRIACWPDVTGCLLSQSTGLSLVGTVPEGLSKEAIVAFAPKMFESVNKSFREMSGRETDALSLPAPGTSFHIFRNKDLYLIIMCRLTQMPERHMKVARFVLSALGIRRD